MATVKKATTSTTSTTTKASSSQPLVKTSAGYETASQTLARASTLLASSKASTANSSTNNTSAITPASLQSPGEFKIPPATLPKVPDFAANSAGLVNPATGVTAAPNGTLTVTPPAPDKYAGASKLQNDFQTALASLNTPSGADVQRKLEQDTGLQAKQQAVNDYSAQLNTIVANRDASKLKVEGQGRGIPEVIIGGQQAQIDKEAAIQALPVQAQLAAAQGNLALAQDHINTWGKILMEDATNQYNRKKEVLTSVRDFAVGLEFKRIDDLEKANERKYQETQALTKAKTAAISQALGQNAPASIVNAIKGATTAEEVVAATGIYNGDVLGQQIKKKQLADLYAPKAEGTPEVKNFGTADNPIWKQWNGKTWADVSGIEKSAVGNALASAVAQNNISTINNVINSKAIGSTVGPSAFAKTSPGLWGAAKRFVTGALGGAAAGAAVGAPFGGVGAVPGAVLGALGLGIANVARGSGSELSGDRQNLIASVEQLTGQLTIDNLVRAKASGATFGALSDGERGLLAAAATKINTWAEKDSNGKVTGYNVSESVFKKEMDNINNLAKLDYLMKGGNPADIGAVAHPDGTVWVTNSDGSFSQIK